MDEKEAEARLLMGTIFLVVIQMMSFVFLWVAYECYCEILSPFCLNFLYRLIFFKSLN